MTSLARWGIDGPSFGLALGGASSGAEFERIAGWAQRAEQLEMHSLWLPEMHFVRGACSAPLHLLAALAARTERLRLATTSLLLPIHDPERVAAEVAALDVISGGRVILGLGRGFRAPLFRAFGIDAKTKRDRFDAALDRILELWQKDGPDPASRPIQTPHPPLAVAAFGRKGLMQAARRALPYLASPMEPLDQLAENLAFHRENLPDDANPDDIVVPIMRTLHVAADDAEARRVKQALEREAQPGRPAVLPPALARAAAASVDERSVIGTASEVADQLAGYREELGWDLCVVRPPMGGCSPTERLAALDRLMEVVLPVVRRG